MAYPQPTRALPQQATPGTDDDETGGTDTPETDADAGASAGGGSTPSAGNDDEDPSAGSVGYDKGGKAKLDKHVSEVLWQRVAALAPPDVKALDNGISREAGRILLKIVPELSMLVLEGTQMQGPDMQPVRDMFDHDAQLAHLRNKFGGGPTQPPGGAQPAAPAQSGTPPSAPAQPASGLRQF